MTLQKKWRPVLHRWKLKLRFFNLYKNTFIVSFEIKKTNKQTKKKQQQQQQQGNVAATETFFQL